MNKIKQLTAHLRLMHQRGDIITDSDDFATALNQIDIASESQAVPFQKCPKCDGQGIVAKPPFIAGDVHQWSSTSVTFPCDVCNGAKIISMNHIIK